MITRRVVGWLIDYTIVMVPGAVLVVLAMASLVHGLPAYIGGVAGEVGWSKLWGMITRHAEVGALRAAASGEWLSFALPLLAAILAVPVIQFIYQASMLAWRGRTAGKMLTDVRIIDRRTAARIRRGVGVRRAFVTTFAEAGLVSVAFLAIAIGQLTIGGFLWLVAVAVFWLNAFAALGPSRRTVVDRLCGTVIVRDSQYTQAAVQTVALAQRTSDAALAVGRATADAAVIAGQLTREGAEVLLQSAPIQQVRDSRFGQTAQALGSAGAVQARRLGGRAQQMWQARRAVPPETGELPEIATRPENEDDRPVG